MRPAIVFLLDVDNTMLDNDRGIDDLRGHLKQAIGSRNSDRYWAIFEHAIGKSDACDEAIHRRAGTGGSDAALFFGLTIEDQTRAADLFRPAFYASAGADGRVSLKVSPLLADDAAKTVAADLAIQIDCMQRRELPDGWDVVLPSFEADAEGLATRDSSAKVLYAAAAEVPWLLDGTGDLAPSTRTSLVFDFAGEFQPGTVDGANADNRRGRNLHFGVREHAMRAIASGLALSGLRAFTASYFVFTDYCRGAIRLAAMMGVPVIYVWTHDSIAMGEDGPTHQPIEQLASSRAMPGMVLSRPPDANEVVEAWREVMQLKDRPASLVLSRQALPTLDRARYASAAGVARGAYVLADASDGRPDVLLLATGSEVAPCIAALEELKDQGIATRVVSMPSWELFENQDAAYRDRVLPPSVAARVSVEASSPLGWERYVGAGGAIIAMRSFGLSAPGKVAQAQFNFDVAHVVTAARQQLARHAPAA